MKKICIFEPSFNTLITPWLKYTFEHIERFIKYEKNTYEVVKLGDLKKGDTVYFCGYSTSKIVDFIIENKEINGILIENISCDDSIEQHKNALDKLFVNNGSMIRSMEFLRKDIQKVFLNYVPSGKETKISGKTFLNELHFDSLDIMNLSLDIEDHFNTELDRISYTKPLRVKELVSLLESGHISEKFEKK